MIIIKFSSVVVEENLTTNKKIPALFVKEGLPKNCKLVNAKVDRDNGILELWFLETEEAKEINITIENYGFSA